ncbi:hypothetical protein [Leptolyngbya sp. KIOST-1]|uniref:hypothetical protein n=1 Tax=Leptolyngbya sp. KIOST-1 TaxID=1229172 RepID=UPI000561D47B|nr:hypothetical protein [Leptolyngbya sp. KIOST-1]
MSINNNDLDPNLNPDRNPDPVTGEPGSHPVGTGVGAAGAGVIGTAVGVIAGGPIGGAIGAVVGSAAGGLLGKSVAETLDPTVEDIYWRDNYHTRPYVDSAYTYDDYSPAYRTGYEGYSTYRPQGMTYQQAEPYLRQRYERDYPGRRLGWDKARYASQDAWYRVEHGAPVYADDDYWRQNYSSRPYIESGYTYDDYSPAYRIGQEGYSTYYPQGMTYQQAEPHLRQRYEQTPRSNRLGWDKARYAIQDAWYRLEHGAPSTDEAFR